MEVFNNCRICLQTINHEPIKMTRLILKFIEQNLHMKNVGRQWKNTKQNICAACFNKFTEFQDFFQELQEADVFWSTQFSNGEEAESKGDSDPKPQQDQEMAQVSSTREMPPDDNKEPERDEEQGYELFSTVPEGDTVQNPPQGIQETVNVDNAVNVEDWPNCEEDTIIDLESNSPKQSDVIHQEVIEFEYELQQESVIERQEYISEESLTIMEDGNKIETQTFEYEEIDDDEESGDTILQLTKTVHGSHSPESLNEAVGEVNETSEDMEVQGENTYIIITTADDAGKVKKSYQCQHCDRSFDRIYDIESHYNIHSDIKPFKCNECGKSFRQKNVLTTHQALHFGKKVICPECGKKFARRSQLILHFRMHRDEKPFVCGFDGCGAAFRQRQHLIDHSFIHTGEKSFQCVSCSKTFQTRKRLQDHMYKVHSYHRYGCDMCEKAFLKPHMLKNHLSFAHKVELNDVSHLKTTIDQIKPSRRSKS